MTRFWLQAHHQLRNSGEFCYRGSQFGLVRCSISDRKTFAQQLDSSRTAHRACGEKGQMIPAVLWQFLLRSPTCKARIAKKGHRVPRSKPSLTFGGGPIVGVASTNKGTSIREFDQKRRYNEWQFIYTPMMERVGLIKTPYQAQQLFEGGMPPTVLPGQTTDYGTSAPGTAALTPTSGGSGNNSQPQGSSEQQP